MLRFVLQLVAGAVLLLLGMVVPQLELFVGGSRVLAFVAGAVIAAAFTGLMLWAARTARAGLIAAAVGAALIIFTPVVGTDDFQLALNLSNGKALDDVPLARVLAEGREGTWVRINDARVRSEVNKQLSFTKGDGRNGRSTTQSRIAVSPVTLASEVSAEEQMLRRRPDGVVPLWACAPDTFRIEKWDRERQAVRGRLAHMEDHVLLALNRELAPSRPMPVPGAGAIPAAPGAVEAPVAAEAPVLQASSPAWCVHLESAVDGATAKQHAVESLLVFCAMLPVIFALVAMGVARIK